MHFARSCGVVGAAAIVAAGCAGHPRVHSAEHLRPKLPRGVAAQLAAASADVARRLDAGDACGALAAARDLQQRTIDAINAGSVPGPLQEPLQATVSDLAGRIRCRPQPASSPPAVRGNKHAHGHKHHGKHGGDDEGKAD